MIAKSNEQDRLRAAVAQIIERRKDIKRPPRVRYKRALVTFLDILGFSDLIARLPAPLVLELMQTFRLTGNARLSEKKLHIHFMSDSIVRVFEIERSLDSPDFVQFGYLKEELSNLTKIQFQLACWYGIFVRGGITIGDIYSRKGMIFGPALNEAYQMESLHTIQPRISIHPRIVKSLQTENVLWGRWPDNARYRMAENKEKADELEGPGYRQDLRLTETFLFDLFMLGSDNTLFIDYMGDNIKYASATSVLQHKESIQKAFIASDNEKIKAKYSWLAHYHNTSIENGAYYEEVGINDHNRESYLIRDRDVLIRIKPNIQRAPFEEVVAERLHPRVW